MDSIAFKRPVLYEYDPQTKEYRGEARPDIDVAALGRDVLVFIPPAFTTDVKPPTAPAGSVAAWDQGKWTLVADYRGETWWRGDTPVIISGIGDPKEAGLSRERPEPPTPPPEDPREVRRRELTKRLDDVLRQGGSYVALRRDVPGPIMAEHDSIIEELRALDSKE